MACGGCGKGRAGTAAVKDRKREATATAPTPPADRVSTTIGSVNPKNTRYAEYLRALRQHGTNQG